MKLTRKKAIELCIELWTWLAKTGKKKKEDWPKWENYRNYNRPRGSSTAESCWLCEYGYQRRKSTKKGETCDYCPYKRKYRIVCNADIDDTDDKQLFYYSRWEDAKTPRTRKKYAKLFLEQIKSIE